MFHLEANEILQYIVEYEITLHDLLKDAYLTCDRPYKLCCIQF